MKSLALFYVLGIFVVGNNAAPYVHHEPERTTVVYPDDHQQTTDDEGEGPGPQIRKLNGEGMENLIHDLFNFVEILLDPQSYTNQHEVRNLYESHWDGVDFLSKKMLTQLKVLK